MAQNWILISNFNWTFSKFCLLIYIYIYIYIERERESSNWPWHLEKYISQKSTKPHIVYRIKSHRTCDHKTKVWCGVGFGQTSSQCVVLKMAQNHTELHCEHLQLLLYITSLLYRDRSTLVRFTSKWKWLLHVSS